LSARAPIVIGIALNRRRPDFTERDGLCLDLISRYLLEATHEFFTKAIMSGITGAARFGSVLFRLGRELAARTYPYRDLPVRVEGKNQFRPVLDGATHSGFHIELHETTLAPGSRPHPPHHHVHEEIFLMREGEVEVTLNGNSTRLGPGSVAYVASNVEHGIRNAGDGLAQYFVMALGTDRA
jgi:quercetin dioxygenase-like cupin family protein